MDENTPRPIGTETLFKINATIKGGSLAVQRLVRDGFLPPHGRYIPDTVDIQIAGLPLPAVQAFIGAWTEDMLSITVTIF